MSLYEVSFVMVLVGGLAFVQASKGRELDGCAGFGTCCPGKNVTCIGRGPSQNNKTSGRCFCDEDCGRLGDCCLDYRFTCKSVNCLLSDTWSEWSNCDHQCGVGAQQRTRQVLVHPVNGGKKCTGHIERKMCEGFNCKLPPTINKGDQKDSKVSETANIVPAVYASWRQNVLYNPLVDIRQSLFLHQRAYSSLQLKDKTPSYCAKFRVTETRGACHRQSPGSDQPPPRTKALTVGATVCVECQPFGILQRTRSSKCIGDGIHMMETPWNAVTAPRCHGKWVMTSQHQTPCHCDATSETSFIFV